MGWPKQILWARFPEQPWKSLSLWANAAIISSLIMLAGSLRVFQTAQNPFEQYLGVAVTAIRALCWAGVFAFLVPKNQ
ncbi:MAG: hypothetical protein EXR99_06370 [Gemmataceae bacterium]|nr:hypothetical protein [Gemmataceae bacterium]